MELEAQDISTTKKVAYEKLSSELGESPSIEELFDLATGNQTGLINLARLVLEVSSVR